ncbi:MAG: SIS domain-containing protein [Armatimonadota bacterium]|nr:SIS domain-containing protein [Armatimonadota bacterium]
MRVSQYISSLQDALGALSTEAIAQVEDALLHAWREQRSIFLAGNGGSAATASHLANDLNKGAIVPGQPRFRAVALTDNVPLMTAWANDAAYDRVFVEQMTNLLRPGDLFVAISGSGNSANIVVATQWAREHGATTIGFTGGTGGRLRGLVDHCIVVPTDRMEQIEDVHLVLAHALCTALRARIAAMPAAAALER